MPGSIHNVRVCFVEQFRNALVLTLTTPQPGHAAPLLIVSGVAGLGKTLAAAQLLVRKRVTWISPRRAMLDELRRNVCTPMKGLEPLPGPDNGAPQIEAMPRKEDGLCSQFHQRIVPLRERGLGRHEAALGCHDCPARSNCAYREWQPTARWLHAPMIWLGLGVPPQRRLNTHAAVGPKLFHDRDVIVIDESPLNAMLQAVTVVPSEIAALSDAFDAVAECDNAAFLAFRALLLECRRLLANPPAGTDFVPLRALLAGFVFSAKRSRKLERIAARLGNVRRVGPEALLAMFTSVRGLRLSARQRELLAGLADALALDVIAERPTAVLRLSGPAGDACGISAGLVRFPAVPLNTPVVLLDATADPAVCRRLFPGRPIIEVGNTPDLVPDQTARVIQAVDRRRARYVGSTLTHVDGRALDKLLQVADRQRKLNPDKRHMLILKKGCDLQRVRQSFPNSADVGAFWGVRGTNEFEGADVLTVVGAPELPALEMEGLARAFNSLVTVFPGSRLETLYRSETRDLPNGLVDRGYPRGFEHHIYWAMHQAEYSQAIHRARIYDGKPKTVIFLSSVRVDSVAVEVVDLDQLLGKPTLAQSAIEYLQGERASGRVSRITRAEVAKALGVGPSALGMALHREGKDQGQLFAALCAAKV